MKKAILVLLALTTLLQSCNNDNEFTNELFTEVYSKDNLSTQTFKIDAQRDTILQSESGTILRIFKNTFVNGNGEMTVGPVEIEFKEALTIFDMVMSNLTTTTNGKMLQTGGMIYINAKSNGQPIAIGENNAIGILLPTDELVGGMQLFEGVEDSSRINWINPTPLLNDMIADDSTNDGVDTLDVQFVNQEAVNNSAQHELRGLEVANVDNLEPIELNQEQIFVREIQPQQQGFNFFRQDQNTSYIFAVKKLGWANIDRLLSDPRTKEVEFITIVDNHSSFKSIYVTMVTEQMFLPGYQMANETFSFTHFDSEKPKLPVGASATIMATAYKNDKPYFAFKKITISDRQTVQLKLTETTLEGLKKKLEREL